MTHRRLPHGERFFPDKLKAHFPVKNEGLPVFHHYADPEFIEALFCGIFFRRLEETSTHALSLKVWEKIQRGDVETILIPVKGKSYITGNLTIRLKKTRVNGSSNMLRKA